MNYCPLCKSDLVSTLVDGVERLMCSARDCRFIHWDNPIPVVAIIVEHEGAIVLANNVNWPENIFSIITGFLEKGESTEECAVREVEEELGLRADSLELIEVYPFHRMNQVIIGYYVRAYGTVQLNEELRSWKHVIKEDLWSWDSATGYILRDWLHSQGLKPQEKSLFGSTKKKKKDNRGPLYQRIDDMVRQIPAGQLATYGQIAKLVGSCGARQVGYAMAALDEGSDVPWHRVINSQGRISTRTGTEGHTLQRIILEEEGVCFNEKGKVDLETYRWPGPESDE